ncbi:hypothetical protein M5585_20750 [Serratia ureilytica]
MSVLNILEEKLAETKKQGRFREFLNLERGVQDKPWPPATGTTVSAASTSGARTTIWR